VCKTQIIWKCANKNLSVYIILNIMFMFRIYLPKPTVLGILIVNNFLTKSMKTKNRIVCKCTNENLTFVLF